MGLPCLNCKQDVSPDDAKVFAEVFLCSSCFVLAERLFRRGEQELRMMLLVLKETIRISALRGELQFAFEGPEELKKEDLVTYLAELAATVREGAVPRSNEPCPTSVHEPTPLLGTTSQSAPSADGEPSSS